MNQRVASERRADPGHRDRIAQVEISAHDQDLYCHVFLVQFLEVDHTVVRLPDHRWVQTPGACLHPHGGGLRPLFGVVPDFVVDLVLHHQCRAVAARQYVGLRGGDHDRLGAINLCRRDKVRCQISAAPFHLDHIAHGDVRVHADGHGHTPLRPLGIHAVFDHVFRQLRNMQFGMAR
ncbi:hypothetical protein D3C71_1077040 [compost metagenome]